MPQRLYTEAEVIERARFAVSLPYEYGHSDIGDVLVSLLKGEIAATEAHYAVECFISDCTDPDKQ